MGQEISSWITGPILVAAFLLLFGGVVSVFVTSYAPNNPNYPTNAQLNFIVGVNGFVNASNSLVGAAQRIISPQGPIFTDESAFSDAAISLIKIMVSIPTMIGGFIYDIVHVVLFVLPQDPGVPFLAFIGMIVVIALVGFVFAVIGIIRGPAIAQY